MKKLFFIPLIVILNQIMAAQPVAEYLYKFENGITVKPENTWSQVWVQQSNAPLAAGDQNPLAVNIRTLGDLIAGSSYELFANGKNVKLKEIQPGTYNLKMTFKLSGKPGTLSFLVNNIAIKPKTKTSVDITLYDYQIFVEETVASGSLSSFDTEIHRCKISTVQNYVSSIPAFYKQADHKTPVMPDEGSGKPKGTIKPGTYDVLLNISISGKNQKVWLENVQMKPGNAYKFYTNLNAGGLVYSGTNRDVKSMHLYPAGTAAKQTGTPAPVKNLEIISYENITDMNCCLPGVFDVLLSNTSPNKNEWRKNIAVNTGARTEVK
ncbi:MAG TPA: hypothetical protein VK213_03570 [Bacteroidales bacterium]|nr:hypothetical protein [Bacteroidales bacterium]